MKTPTIKTTVLAAAMFGAPLFFAGCAEHVSLNQLPAEARTTVDREVGEGKIHEIESHSDKGMIYYDVEYTRAKQDMDLRVSEHGDILKKDTD